MKEGGSAWGTFLRQPRCKFSSTSNCCKRRLKGSYNDHNGPKFIEGWTQYEILRAKLFAQLELRSVVIVVIGGIDTDVWIAILCNDFKVVEVTRVCAIVVKYEGLIVARVKFEDVGPINFQYYWVVCAQQGCSVT